MLPLFKDNNQTMQLLQTKWKSILDPIIGAPQNNSNVIGPLALINGVTVVNHKLGRTPQGWRLVDMDASAIVYRSASFNDLTLSLTSNAAVNVKIEVF